MTTLFRILDRMLETLLFLTLASMAAVVAANVFCRFVLQFSLSWGDETAQILLVWLTFLGAAVVTRDKAHFAFDYLVGNLPEGLKRHVMVLTHLIVVGATLGLLYWSGQVAWQMRHWVMPALEISRAWVYGACPVGCVFILLYALRHFFHDLQDGRLEPVGEDGKL